eukprot:1587443-Prymnesium_polylepis.1
MAGIGLKEMQAFCEVFYGDRSIKNETFLESCGVADLVTTCFGGRNRKVSPPPTPRLNPKRPSSNSAP